MSLATAACLVGCGESSSPTAASRIAAPAAAPSVAPVIVGVAGDAAPSVAPGGRLQVWAVARYSDQSTADVANTAEWQSSNPSLATISRDGILTAAGEGSVDVVAAMRGVSGSLHATIARAGCDASTLSPALLTFNAFEHLSQEVKVMTPRPDCRWLATSDADWLRFSSGNNRTTLDPGQSGSVSFFYQLLANNFTATRSATVTVAFSDGTWLVHAIAQEPPVSCSYVIKPDDGFFRAAGGVGSFDVTANTERLSVDGDDPLRLLRSPHDLEPVGHRFRPRHIRGRADHRRLCERGDDHGRRPERREPAGHSQDPHRCAVRNGLS